MSIFVEDKLLFDGGIRSAACVFLKVIIHANVIVYFVKPTYLSYYIHLVT